MVAVNTFASIFGGCGGSDKGAETAGLCPVWTVEADADVAGVHAMNFDSQIVVARAQDVDYSRLASPFWLHASNECTRASVANANGGESEEDIGQARAVERALTATRPDTFSLENAWKYRTFESFRIVCNALESNGYKFDYWHLNSADYGVPQTRKRLVLLASKTLRPTRPQATHRERADMFLPKWVGWYEAVEDLIPTLPESKFAPWQLKRLPAFAEGSFYTIAQQSDDKKGTEIGYGCPRRSSDQPALTVTTQTPSWFKAFIADGFNSSHENITRDAGSPMFTYTANNGSGRNNPIRAFIVDGKPASYEGELQIVEGDSHDGTVTASQTRHPFRAFVLDGRNTRTTTDEPFTVREGREPFFSVTASDGSERHRAFVEGLAQSQSGLFTPEPAWLALGRVVSMTPRALARLQSFPDDFQLPEKNALACRVIGNAVPPLLMRRAVESHVRALKARAA